MPSLKSTLLWFLAMIGGLTLAGLTAAWFARDTLVASALRRGLAQAGVEVTAVSVDVVSTREISASGLKAVKGPHSLQISRISGQFEDSPLDGFKHVTLDGVALQVDPFALVSPPSTPTPEAVQPKPHLSLPFKTVDILGTLRVGAEPVDPALTWRVQLAPGEKPPLLLVKATAEGLDSSLVASGLVDPETRAGSITLPSFHVQLSSWYPWAVRKLPDLETLGSLSGAVEGQGDWKFSDGRQEGRLAIALQEVGFNYLPANLTLSGVYGKLALPGLPKLMTEPSQRLSIARVAIGDREFTKAAATFQILDQTHVAIDGMECDAFGGHVSTGPFQLSISPLSATADVTVNHLDLAELSRLFPLSKFAFTGRVSGKVPVLYDGNMLNFGRGWLVLDSEVPATMTFNQPGLITGSTPPSSPAYTVLKKVEDGLLSLRVKSLRVELYPSKEENERSATIQVEAEPLDPGVKAPVFLNLNINGPIAKLVNWGTNSKLNFSTDLSR